MVTTLSNEDDESMEGTAADDTESECRNERQGERVSCFLHDRCDRTNRITLGRNILYIYSCSMEWSVREC